MKKYHVAYIVLAIGVFVSFFWSAVSIAKLVRLPLLMRNGLSSTVASGGERGVWSIMTAILMPLLCAFLFFLMVRCYQKALATPGICQELEQKRKNFSLIHLMIFIGVVWAIVSVAFLYVHRETVWSHLLAIRGYDGYMDFFNHITYARYPDETYYETHHACFPALAYIFYYALSRVLPMDATVKFSPGETSPYAMLIYVFYMILLCFLFALLVKKLLAQEGKAVAAFTALLLVSNCFISVIERGNSAMIVLLLLMGAMLLRNSEKPWQREVALLLIAIAAGLKIYPAMFGLLYLVEKRYKEAARLLLYGILLFFVPFLFFGGFDALLQFLKNQELVQELESVDQISLQSIRTAVHYFSDKFTGNPRNLESIEQIVPFLFAGVNALFVLSKKTALWEKVFLLCSIMVFFPAWSGSYTPIYFVIPMLLFLHERKESFAVRGKDIYSCVIGVCFALAFSMIFLVTSKGERFSDLSYLALYAINAMILVRAGYGMVSSLWKKQIAHGA